MTFNQFIKPSEFNGIFENAVSDYHLSDNVDTPCNNPFPTGSIEFLLYGKCWIDSVQWHLEDLIRNPDINPAEALDLKRRIDKSNQERTDMVEYIDAYFLDSFKGITPLPDARINTETPAWAVDRLSILALKIWHMKAETERDDASPEHIKKCREKLDVLLQQRIDLTQAICELFEDILSGRKYMRLYKQMKMYNDADTNPVLYTKK